MSETKPWFRSFGVWGGVIGTLGGIATVGAVGLNAVFGEGTATEAEINAIYTGIAAAVGGVAAIYGRIVARKAIG